ncbi:hypothetical protein HBO13_30765 [Pseudomonas lactis]|uniref:Uncharacterized protein n=1 Tax=Pseudomonas lactis TaxID=1615674 RepID=A0A7Y1M896_9PSED|nr:hypothetical protein [Pseudomonas lactis]NNA77020.1 hypothetical protein [Pseudomonas lactis]
MNRISRQVVKGDAELMMDAGIFMNTIAALVSDNLTEETDDEGNPFLNGYRLDGLMKGLKLAGSSLCARSENLTEVIEEAETKEEKLAQAALARRQGRDTTGKGNVGAECGTQRAA